MASVNRDTGAAQVSMNYRPSRDFGIDAKGAEDTALLANRALFKEQERQAQEKRALRDKMIDLQNQGLPKQFQGQINHSVEELRKEVEDGKIDPSSYEFRSRLAKIQGQAGVASALTADGVVFLGADTQLLDFEGGNPRDIKGDINSQFTSLYGTEYDPSQGDAIGAFGGVFRGAQGRVKPPMEVDTNRMDEAIESIYDMEADELSELFEDKFGYVRQSKTKGLTPEERKKLKNALKQENQAALASSYAKLGSMGGTGQDFATWSDNYIAQRLPQVQVTEDVKTNLTAQEAGKNYRANLGNKGASTPFELSTTTVNVEEDGKITPTDYKMWGAGDETIDGKKVSGIILKDGKLQANIVNQGVSDDESLAINYINKKNAAFSEGEKVSLQDVITQLKQTESEERGFNKELFAEIDENIEELGDWFLDVGGDNENDLYKFLGEKFSGYNFKDDDAFKEFRGIVNGSDFDQYEDRVKIIGWLKKKMPEVATRAKTKGDKSTKKPKPY